MRVNTNKVFFSVYQASKSQDENQQAHAEVVKRLTIGRVSFRVVRGVYKGTVEDSFLLESTDYAGHLNNLTVSGIIARDYAQESILEVHNDNAAVLHTLTGAQESTPVGTFGEVSRSEAETAGSYTVDPITGKHYGVS